jgi:hypothetical protein
VTFPDSVFFWESNSLGIHKTPWTEDPSVGKPVVRLEPASDSSVKAAQCRIRLSPRDHCDRHYYDYYLHNLLIIVLCHRTVLETVASLFKARTVLDLSETDRGFESRSRHGCMSAFFCVVLSCAMGRSPVQGLLPKCLKDLEFQNSVLNQNRPEDPIRETNYCGGNCSRERIEHFGFKFILCGYRATTCN